MKRRTTGLFAGALLAFGAATTAFAGAHQMQPVVVDAVGMFAYGDLSYSHNTPNVIEYIGCNSNGANAVCIARNAAGLTRSCTTANPAHLDVIHSLGTDSNLTFRWNAAGACTNVTVLNSSLTVPKV